MQPVIYPTKVEYADLSAKYYIGCQHGCLYCYNMLFHKNKFNWTYEKWISMKPRLSRKNLLLQLRKDIKRYGDGHKLYLSFCHDPFPPLDEKLQYTGEVLLTILMETDWEVWILTKAPMRGLKLYLPLLQEYKDRVWYGVTLTHYNDELAKTVEPYSEPPSKRMNALRLAKEVGLHVWISLEPWIPYWNNKPYLPNPIKLLEKLPIKPDLLIIGKLNHLPTNPQPYKQHYPQLIKYLQKHNYQYIIKKELSSILSPKH